MPTSKRTIRPNPAAKLRKNPHPRNFSRPFPPKSPTAEPEGSKKIACAESKRRAKGIFNSPGNHMENHAEPGRE